MSYTVDSKKQNQKMLNRTEVMTKNVSSSYYAKIAIQLTSEGETSDSQLFHPHL